MSGSVAALALAERDLDIVVLEASPRLGGAALLSAGRIWTYPTLDEVRRYVPLGDAVLHEQLVSELGAAIRWLGDAGLPLDPQPRYKSGFGVTMGGGRPGDQRPFFDEVARVLGRRGVVVRTETRVNAVERGRDRVTLATADGAVTVDWVLLATGGVHGDAEVLGTHLGHHARDVFVRSAASCRGDGVGFGRRMGGGTSRGLGWFYGHTLPAIADLLEPDELKAATLGIATEGLVANQLGQRFVDESVGRFEEHIAAAGVHQPGGRYYLIGDAHHLGRVPTALIDRVAARGSRDEVVIVDDDVDALVLRMEEVWGVPAQPLRGEIRAWNDGRSDPPRLKPPRALVDPPFVGVRCQPSITLSGGGLAVDERMRLLDVLGEPVPRAHAVGADAGGVSVGAYCGGLAWATVSGRLAARDITATVAPTTVGC